MGISIETKMLLTLIQSWDKEMFEAVSGVVQKWTNIIETEAKDEAPKDRGQLKASINNKLFLDAVSVVGVVGTNKFYGYYQHEGFQAHWIPFYNPPTWDYKSSVRYPDMIKWARRHGFDVDGKKDSKGHWIKKPMKGIWVRGLPNPFMQKAYENNVDKFQKDLENTVQKVVNKINGD